MQTNEKYLFLQQCFPLNLQSDVNQGLSLIEALGLSYLCKRPICDTPFRRMKAAPRARFGASAITAWGRLGGWPQVWACFAYFAAKVEADSLQFRLAGGGRGIRTRGTVFEMALAARIRRFYRIRFIDPKADQVPRHPQRKSRNELRAT